MKKRIIVIALSLLATVGNANAQFLQYGVKGSLTSSTVKFETTKFTAESTKEYIAKQGDSKYGFQFGVFVRVKLLSFFVQPEVLFSHSQNEVLLEDVTANKVYTETQKFNKIDIPVIIGRKFGPLRIGLGPVASFMLNESDGLKDKLSDLSTETTKNNFKNATFGYQIGAGLDILKKITFDIKYEGNLSKLGTGIKLGDTKYNFDQRNPQWIFSIGVFL